jgi:DNA-directed RNA polymerase subunit omega
MIMPLEQLIEYDLNAYEITVAITRRAYQLGVIKNEDVEKCNGKVVSLATRQVFAKDIEYKAIED